MITAVWSVKGGVGVTSVAGLLAVAQIARAEDTVLIDLCGDVAAVLGVEAKPAGPGIAEWCAMDRADPDALARVEVEARPGLTFVPRGHEDFPVDPVHLMSVLATSRRTVIIDCGVIAEQATFARRVVETAPTSLMVVRECFLGLQAAQAMTLVPSGVVVIKEDGRHLGRADVESVTGAPVLAQVAFDCSISRSVDAGIARARLPRTLLRRLGRVMPDAA